MARADVVVFDKTGTLTVADPAVRKVVTVGDLSRAEVLRLAACIEEHFPHSVARAIVRAAQEEALHHEEEHTEVEYIVAHGIATSIRGRRAIIGSRHFVFDDEKTPLDERSREIIEREIGGDSAVFLAVDGRLAGFICVGDPPRPDAARAISGLRALGIQEIIMLTGDNHSAAKRIADQLGIDRFFAQVLPKDKVSIIEALKKEGKNIMMVGDGVNDSPALAAADVSVSMKDSSDIAREVADVTLLSSDLTQLVSAIKLSRGLMERIRGNFRLIIAFNTALLLLGIADIITPTASALLHNAATLGISAAGMRPCLPGPGAGEED
jgi:P-type E1-E2 ATPase